MMPMPNCELWQDYYRPDSCYSPSRIIKMTNSENPKMRHITFIHSCLPHTYKPTVMDAEGTVAVVRGIPGAGLTVTLFDSGRQYTLLPENFTHPTSNSRPNDCHISASRCANYVTQRDTSVQATDGRYASTYKTMHCHVTPTSPPDELTEFPPQKAEILPGHGNFEVGGLGSGEGVCTPTRCTSFRGGMSWPDRGSVFSPRPSAHPDSFATSLRKYPSLAPDRSSEIVERLINFTQAKNMSKISKNSPSPTRNIDSDQSNRTFCLDGISSRSTQVKSTRRYEPEVHVRPKRFEESPTRESPKNTPSDPTNIADETKDIRYSKDKSRKVWEGTRSLSAQSHCHLDRLGSKDKCESTSPSRRKAAAERSTNSVNMEIQAAVQMISREVVTVPRTIPSLRSIAIPVTPQPSNIINQGKTDKNKIDPIVEAKLTMTDMTIQEEISTTIVNNRYKKILSSKIRSKSEEEMQTEYNTTTKLCVQNTNCSKIKYNHKDCKYNKSFRTLLKLVKDLECSKRYQGKNTIVKCSSSKICYAKIARHKNVDEEIIVDVLDDWINLIPLKFNNSNERQILKEFIRCDLLDLLKNSSWCVQLDNSCVIDKLKCDLINRLEHIPLELKGNKKYILKKLTDILVTKIKYFGYRKLSQRKIQKSYDYEKYNSVFQRYIAPTEDEIRKFVSQEIKVILESSSLSLKTQQCKYLEEDLVNVAMIGMEFLRCNHEGHIIKNIADLFRDYGLTEKCASSCARILVKHLIDTFIYTNHLDGIKSQTLIVLPNYQNIYHSSNHFNSDFTEPNATEIGANLEHYTNVLCKEIDEWLSNINIQIQDTDIKKAVVNELANDIIDRHKYLSLNAEQNTSDETELDHLKYQIFKWINKIVGENNLQPLDRAVELMDRIKQISGPRFSRSMHKSLTNDTKSQETKAFCKNVMCNNSDTAQYNPSYIGENISMNSTQTPNLSIPEYKSSANAHVSNTPACCSIAATEITKNIEQLEAEYENFVEDWVQRIPIEISDVGEDITEKARLGIHNGLWKIVSKLNCDPATYYNRFLYEDLLDDAIDELLDCLPQTPALQSRRHVLKVEFIEKTVDINNKIKDIEETSFRNKLMKNLVTNLRKQGITETRGDDPIKLHEDLQIIKIVDDYILSTRFRDEDKVKSEVYKKKLMKEVETFVHDLKRNHVKELKDIDVSSYKADVVSILQKVPIPSENTVKQEADDVLLGIEIEQWYNDLPIVPNDSYTEQYQRRRQRDILTRKIKDLEVNESENAMKNEISRFLEKTPLKEGESLNINFMVDELVNRIKNKYTTDERNKKAIFTTPKNYKDFSDNIPLCSSLIYPKSSTNAVSITNNEITKNPIQLENVEQQAKLKEIAQFSRDTLNSTLHRNHIVIKDPPTYRVFDEERPISSSFKEPSHQQWNTLEDSQLEAGRREHISMQSLPPYNPLTKVKNHEQNTDLEYYQGVLLQHESEKNPENLNKPSISTSRGTKTDRGILGISQVAGPSGYLQSHSENALRYLNVPEVHPPSPIHSRRPSSVTFKDQNFENNQFIPGQEKCSIECQTHHRKQNSNEVDFPAGGKVCRAIDTSDFLDTEVFASTPEQTRRLTIPSVPSKRRAKMDIDDRDKVRRRLDLDGNDDNDVPCRCIENFWKKRQNLKRYTCEDFERYPPYLPIFFPYPYPTFF